MKVALTGASGLLGANLAIALLEQGHEVICTYRKSSHRAHLDGFALQWVEADLDDPQGLAQAFAGTDAVFHCAAAVQMFRQVTPLLQRANVDGTRHILEAVQQAQVPRLIHCSSIVARALANGPDAVTEADPWNFPERGFEDGYAITKHTSEQMVLEAVADGLDAVIVNPTTLFGPYDQRPSSGKIIVNLLKGVIIGYTHGWNNFADARAVAQGMIAAWQHGKRGEAYILGGENLSMRDLFDRINHVAGRKPLRRSIPQPLAALGGIFGELYQQFTGREALISKTSVQYAYCKDFRYSNQKAIEQLNYNPGNLDDAIHDTIQWFQQHKML